MVSTEKATQRTILDWLAYNHIFHYRNNTGGFKTDNGGFYQFGAKGSPDIICVAQGRYIGIEVKDLHGKLSDSQTAFRDNLEKAGGLYLIAKSLDDVTLFFNNLKPTKN